MPRKKPRDFTMQLDSLTLWALIVLSITNTHFSVARDLLVIDTYPSVAYLNEQGEVDGPVASIIKEVCQRMGQKVKLTFNPIQRMFSNLNTHKADAAFNMSHNWQRASKWHYSKPIHRVHYGVFSHLDNPLKYQDRSDLKGYTIVTYGPTNMSKKVEKFSKSLLGSRVEIINQYEMAFKMLSVGRFGKKTVIYAPDTIGVDVIKKWKLKNKIQLAGRDIKNLYYVVFVKKLVTKAFVKEFNRTLLALHDNGTMEKIYNNYKDIIKANPPSIEDMVQFPPLTQ